MTGQFIVCEIKTHTPIEGADKIVSSSVYGETVIINKETIPIGTKGLLIDTESELSEIICEKLNLYRDKLSNDDKDVSGYIEKNRRVRPITLKGIQCSALFLSFEMLSKVPELNKINLESGIEGNDINGIDICNKYQPKLTGSKTSLPSSQKQDKSSMVPFFREHIDTKQFDRVIESIPTGVLVIGTEKVEGASIRISNTLTYRNLSWIEKILSKWIPIEKFFYSDAVGSRRVVKTIGGEENGKPSHFCDYDVWVDAAKPFSGLLRQGETVYAEIVGYDTNGKLLMGQHDNKKLKRFLGKDEYKSFIELYGDTTKFTYDCEEGEHKVFIYRITNTTPQGKEIDLSWEQVKRRSEELGFDHVPELFKVLLSNTKELVELVEFHSSHFSTSYPQHIKEGIVIRTEGSSLVPSFYKKKNFIYKVFANIIKDTGYIDLEDSQK